MGEIEDLPMQASTGKQGVGISAGRPTGGLLIGPVGNIQLGVISQLQLRRRTHFELFLGYRVQPGFGATISCREASIAFALTIVIFKSQLVRTRSLRGIQTNRAGLEGTEASKTGRLKCAVEGASKTPGGGSHS